MLGYGLPDVTGADLASAAKREEFRRRIERVIADFEPRLERVSVDADGEGRIAGPHAAVPHRGDAPRRAGPEPVAFDSAVEPATGNVEVKGAAA